MRASSSVSVSISLVASAFALVAGCTNAEEEGRRAAQQRAALETKREAAQAAPKVIPPVANRAHVSCEQLIDVQAFGEALAEVEPLTLKDTTSSDGDAAASCGLIRGGVRPDQSQQAAIIKKNGGRLGTIPGDELCNVTAYCWTIEDEQGFADRCKQQGFQQDDSMGSHACLQVVAQGADDVYSYKFLDEDTKCILKVRGGPSMIDNALITTCAKAARDLIGKAQIAPGWTPPAAPTDGAGAAPTM